MRRGLSRRTQEVLFFLVYFIGFPLLVVIQYSREPELSGNPFWPSIVYQCIAGLLEIPPFYLFYRWVIPRLLFAKRYWAFAGALLLFAVFYDIYVRLAIDGLIAQMTFLPAVAVKWASSSFLHQRWVRVAVQIYLSDILVVTALAFYMRSRDQERQVEEMKRQQLQLELEYLKAQMNPHFLFNTLNNIYSLAQEQSGETAPLVARLSELMRYVLYDSGLGKVPLSKEVGFIENYMDIERVRYPGGIDVRFDWQGNADGRMIEPLLLIPFVENAFKHGIREELVKGFVEVVALLVGGELTMEVRNSKPTGVRAPEQHGVKKGGLGLQNVRKRLDILYPGKHQLRVREDPGTYTVSLTLQIG